MNDRAILFVVSLLLVIAALTTDVWLVATHQVVDIDGLFLFLASLLVAFVFSLYLRFIVKGALEAAEEQPSRRQPEPDRTASVRERLPAPRGVAAAK